MKKSGTTFISLILILAGVMIGVMLYYLVEHQFKLSEVWHWPPWKPRPDQTVKVYWDTEDRFYQMQKKIDDIFASVFKERPANATASSRDAPETAGGNREFSDHLTRVQQDIDRIFNRAIEDFNKLETFHGFDEGWDSLSATPDMEVREATNATLITVYLPGLKNSDIRLTLRGSLLTIRAEAQLSSNKTTDSSTAAQRRWQRFEKRIRLPMAPRDESRIRATYKDDILHIVVPRAPDPDETLDKEVPLR